MNPMMRMLVMRGLKYGLKSLKSYMSDDDFKLTVDQVLDRVEDYFKEGSVMDDIVEEITGEVRAYFDVPDNDS